MENEKKWTNKQKDLQKFCDSNTEPDSKYVFRG